MNRAQAREFVARKRSKLIKQTETAPCPMPVDIVTPEKPAWKFGKALRAGFAAANLGRYVRWRLVLVIFAYAVAVQVFVH